jgi:hypothetical protein
MRRAATIAIVSVLAAGVLAGCKDTDSAMSDLPRPTEAFCRAAAKYDENVQLEKTTLADQIELVTNIAKHAPKDISKDAQTFLDALKRRDAGDTSVIDNPKIETAVHNVNRRAGQDCGWYKREGM